MKLTTELQIVDPAPESPGSNFTDSRAILGDRYKAFVAAFSSGVVGYGNKLPQANPLDRRCNVAILLGEWFYLQGQYHRALAIYLRIAPEAPEIVETVAGPGTPGKKTSNGKNVKAPPAAVAAEETDHDDPLIMTAKMFASSSLIELKPSPEQRAYVLLRMGLTYGYLFDHEKSLHSYKTLAHSPETASTSYALTAALREAALEFSVKHHKDKALEMLEEIFNEHRQSQEARDAIFFSGVICQWSGDSDGAVDTFKTAILTYPSDTGVRNAVEGQLKKMGLRLSDILGVRKAPKAAVGDAKPR